jgi:PEP-CTERM motif
MTTTRSPRFIKQSLILLAVAVPLAAQAAIDIRFDYTYDGGFFSGVNENRRAVMDLVAGEIEGRLVNETFAALTPAGANTWQLSFDNPGNSGTDVTLSNPIIAANTLTIYVGGSNLGGSGPLGEANFGLSYSGFSSWFNAFEARNNTTNYEPLGGGITFNADANWYFGTDASGLAFSQYDFYTVAAHEVFHILGVGQSDAYDADVIGGQLAGSNVQALTGGPVALNTASGDTGHFASGTTYQGNTPIMVPALVNGVRRYATELDYAVLRDIGYNVTNVPEPSTWALTVLGLLAVAAATRRRQPLVMIHSIKPSMA